MKLNWGVKLNVHLPSVSGNLWQHSVTPGEIPIYEANSTTECDSKYSILQLFFRCLIVGYCYVILFFDDVFANTSQYKHGKYTSIETMAGKLYRETRSYLLDYKIIINL